MIPIAHKSVMSLSLCNSFYRIKVFLVLNCRKFVDWNLDVYMMCKNIICDSNTHKIFILLTGQYLLALIHISYVRKFVLPRISEDYEIAFIFISACWVTVCHVLSQCVMVSCFECKRIGKFIWCLCLLQCLITLFVVGNKEWEVLKNIWIWFVMYSRAVRVTHLLICYRQTLYYKNDLYIYMLNR